MATKVKSAEMTWREVEEARDRGAAVILPMGSTEEHGPHSPTGDFMVTDAVAERVARQTGDVVLPVVPFSYSEYFRHFPGTITVGSETMRLLVRDVVFSVLDQGFTHVILFNGHKGNEPILQTVVREIRREREILSPYVAPSSFGVGKELKKELYGDAPQGHGGEPMGSKMCYLFPDLVEPGRAEDFGVRDVLGQRPNDLNSISFNGNSVGLAINMEDMAPASGSLSDPRLADAERGERMIAASVEALSEFVNWFKSVDPRVSP